MRATVILRPSGIVYVVSGPDTKLYPNLRAAAYRADILLPGDWPDPNPSGMRAMLASMESGAPVGSPLYHPPLSPFLAPQVVAPAQP